MHRNYQQAIFDFNKAIQINPDHYRSFDNRGKVYDRLGDYKKAIDDFTKAIEIKSNYAWAYYNRGVAPANQWDYDKERELNKLPIISRCFCRIQGARRKHNELCAQRGTQKTAKKAIIMGKLFNVRS
jgi:hypothetical protein